MSGSSMEGAPGLARIWGRHRLLAGAVTLTATGAGFVLAPVPDLAVWIGFGVGLAVTGVPHGAADHRVAGPLLRPHLGLWWLPAFLLGYVMLGGAVAAVWTLGPVPALLAFLAVSVLHFGRGDAGSRAGLPVVVFLGMTPLVGPVLFWPQTTARLFHALSGEPAQSWEAGLQAVFWPLVVLYGLLAVVAGRNLTAAVRWDVGLLLVSGLVLPPLASFAVYFCAWHAPRHILDEVALVASHGRSWTRDTVRFFADAAPATVATGVAAVGLWWFWQPTWGYEDAAVRTVFIGLAALTVPHIVLHGVAKRVRPGRPDSRPSGRLADDGADVPAGHAASDGVGAR